MEDIEQKIKVILVGDGGVGKTSYIKRLFGSNDIRTNNYVPSSGVKAYDYIHFSNNKQYSFSLCEVAGQEKFNSSRSKFYKNSSYVFVFFSLDTRLTFKNAILWLKDLIFCTEKISKVIFIGNKSDTERKIGDKYFNKLVSLVEEFNVECYCIEMSCMNDDIEKIKEPFNLIIKQ